MPVSPASHRCTTVLEGIDAILDMARTSVNVVGNCLATAVIARWEGAKLH